VDIIGFMENAVLSAIFDQMADIMEILGNVIIMLNRMTGTS